MLVCLREGQGVFKESMSVCRGLVVLGGEMRLVFVSVLILRVFVITFVYTYFCLVSFLGEFFCNVNIFPLLVNWC